MQSNDFGSFSLSAFLETAIAEKMEAMRARAERSWQAVATLPVKR